MKLKTKQAIIAVLGGAFLVSLLFVQWMEVARKREETGAIAHHIAVPETSRACVECHTRESRGIVDHWTGSTHARKGVGCYECHKANRGEVDAFDHYGATIATIVTPNDCAACHKHEAEEFAHSHHAAAGNILASLDNLLAETVEGSRVPFNPHSPTPGKQVDTVNGMASAQTGCQQCHGSKVALRSTNGTPITVDDLKPDASGKPTNTEILRLVLKDEKTGRPLYVHWPTEPRRVAGFVFGLP
jgi:hydroxylamine dehydrogenase